MRKFGVKEVFSNDWRRTVFWLAVALAALIAGFTFGWIWRDRPQALANVRILDVLTVVGTVGAVIVALGLGVFVHFRDTSVKRREGGLIAAMLSVSLPPVIRQLQAALAEFEEAKDGDRDGSWSQRGCVEMGIKELQNLRLEVTLEELAVLAWANATAAGEISKAIGNIRQINARLVTVLANVEGTDYVPPSKYYPIASHCSFAATLLENARRRCSKLSKVKYRISDDWRIPDTDVCGYPR